MIDGTLTGIEAVAKQLDQMRATRLSEQSVDFDGYLKARDEDIGRIKTTTDFGDELVNEFYGREEANGQPLPWRKTEDLFRIRRGEVTIWTGFNGHMKSMCTGYVTLDQIMRGEKICIASFEMKPRKTLRRMATQAIGTKRPTERFIHKFLDMISGKLFLYDQQGETSPERVLGVIYYCVEQLGVTQFVIDSLMKVVSDEDDYNGQKRFIGQLCAAAKDLNIHIHLVHHSRKRDDEAKRPGKQDAKGTGAIVDQTDNFVVVYKFPRKEGDADDKPTHGLYIDKQRNGEWEGLVALWFDPESLQFKESAHERTRHFVPDFQPTE